MAAAERIALDYLYDACRTALLNRHYYRETLARRRLWSTVLDILVAVGATGSGVAGLAIWTTNVGQNLLPWLLAVSTVLGVAKPILNLGKAIETHAQLYTCHSGLFFDLKAMVDGIALRRQVPADLIETYATLQRRYAELAGLDGGREDAALKIRLQDRVIAEIPVERLWYPAD